MFLASDWGIPETYPALMVPLEDKFTLTFPDFSVTVARTLHAREALTVATAVLRGLLRQRAITNQLVPFASNPDTLRGHVILVPTEGWNNPVDDVDIGS